jgi:ABC-type multidrug transport system ATPase subunit
MNGTIEPALELRNIIKRYGDKVALDDLSLKVARGTIVGLLGPNGAGKSTSLLVTSGLSRPDFGTISIDGEPSMPIELRRAIALIPETPEAFPMLTVWEHMLYVARASRLPDGWQARARALLTRLDLGGELTTLGFSLSKGMRQKILIAAALLRATPILLLDEPMIGLDPRGQRELRDLLAELRAEGRAIVVSTHQLDAAQALCDEIVFMKAGRVVATMDAGATTEALEVAFMQATA